MDTPPADLDIAVEPCDLGALAGSLTTIGAAAGDVLREGLGGVLAPFPVLKTSIDGEKVRIFCITGGSIEDELARRDFSINAMAIRSDGSFIDPFRGRHDVRNSLVRLTGDDEELIRSDPIRIMRMMRFAAELDMRIFWKSEACARSFVAKFPTLINIPAERWGREILSGMKRRPYDFIFMCDKYGLTPFFLNELETLKSVISEGSGTLFDHTLDTLRIVQEFLSKRKRREIDMAFSLAALFHHLGSDVNQPSDSTKTSAIVKKYLKAWNAPAEIVHMTDVTVRSFRIQYRPVSEERYAAYVLKYGAETVELVADFALCNSRADSLKNMDTIAANRQNLAEVVRRFDEAKRKSKGNPHYLSGDDVMHALGLEPGKAVGEVLNALGVAVGTGEVSSRQEAVNWVMQHGHQ
jgi:tRNA nucleotidyltransferase/poly(A) polymerase